MPDDYSANVRTTGTVEVGGSATGKIETAGDVDWFKVPVTAGKIYRVVITPSPEDGNGSRNPYRFEVHGANGNSESETHTGWAGLRLGDCIVPGSATAVWVAVDATGGHTGSYTVSVEEVPDDHAASVAGAGAVAVGGSVRGDLEHGFDRDWFAVELEAGKTYQFDLKGRDTGDGTLQQPHLEAIYDADGAWIPETWDNDAGKGSNDRAFFTAARDGTYHLEVSVDIPHEKKKGTYTLSVAEVLDDYAAAVDGAGTVEIGGAATGKIETAGDRDWFAVALEEGKAYRIDLNGRKTGDGTLRDPYLDGIHDADGAYIDGTWDHDSGAGRNSRTILTPDKDGTYYVAAGGSKDDTGTYTVSVAEVADDFAAAAGTAGTVETGGAASGEVEYAGDRDWFAVALEEGKTYRIDLNGRKTGDGTLRDPYLDGIYDGDGAWISGTADNDGGKGRNSRVIFASEKDGTYYVAAGGSKDDTGTYTVSVVEVVLDDYSADTGTTGRVAVGASAAGEKENAGDRDWFAVTLEAGKTYRIDLKGLDTGDGTLRDPYLAGIYDGDGTWISGTADNDGGKGRNSREIFAPEKDGTYYVAAYDFKDKTGTYTVSVAEELAAGVGTSGRVAVGGSATGEIDRTGDRDWFAVTLEAGKSYRIDLKGRDTGDGTLRNPFLAGVHDADGALIPYTWHSDGGTGRNSRVIFAPEKDGTYYVAAGGSKDHTGTYTVSVAEELAAGVGTSGRVAVGGSATGEIDRTGDRDWFAVTLEAGKSYRIDLKGQDTGDGTLADPSLRGIHDADGARIHATWDSDGGTGRNSREIFAPEKDGTYYVAAGGSKGQAGTYTMSVVEVVLDDYSADTGTTGAVAVGDSATGEIDRLGDNDWFAVTLEAGKSYRIDLKGRKTGDGTLRDPYLDGIYDGDGTWISGTADNDSGAGRNSRVLFTAAETATYYVAVGATGVDTGTYTVSVAEELAAGVGTSGRVAVGGSATGEIDRTGDSDWFAVTLEAGKSYRIDLKGQDTGDGTLADPYLDGIHDANGVRIYASWDYDSGTGRNSRELFTPDKDATYYVAAGANKDHTGTYTVSVEEVVDAL